MYISRQRNGCRLPAYSSPTTASPIDRGLAHGYLFWSILTCVLTITAVRVVATIGYASGYPGSTAFQAKDALLKEQPLLCQP
ncbi:MAG TPA: hypothetical protein V6D50_13760 [Chroococcales cyanobacterium]